MRGRWNMKKPKMLSALKKVQGKEIHGILETIEECSAEDENGKAIYRTLLENFYICFDHSGRYVDPNQ